MTLLDRLAALVVILQFIALAIFGYVLLAHLTAQQASLKAIEQDLYKSPAVMAEPTMTVPSPSVGVKSGLLNGASGAATIPVRPSK